MKFFLNLFTIISLFFSLSGCEVRGIVGSNVSATDGSVTDGSSSTTDDLYGDTTGEIYLDLGSGLPTSYGEYWCVRAEGAFQTLNGSTSLVTYSDGTAPEGCQCLLLNHPVHQWIVENEINNTVTIDETLLDVDPSVTALLAEQLISVRESIYGSAVESCLNQVSPGASSNTCEDPLLFDLDPSTAILEPKELYRGNRLGQTECVPVEESNSSETCDYLSKLPVSFVRGFYEVSYDDFSKLLNDGSCLMKNGWSVGLNANKNAFIFMGIKKDDLMYRLGLREGDQALWISYQGSRFDVQSYSGFYKAYQQLRYIQPKETVEVVVLREGREINLKYNLLEKR